LVRMASENRALPDQVSVPSQYSCVRGPDCERSSLAQSSRSNCAIDSQKLLAGCLGRLSELAHQCRLKTAARRISVSRFRGNDRFSRTRWTRLWRPTPGIRRQHRRLAEPRD
jgi:hypothetical protein